MNLPETQIERIRAEVEETISGFFSAYEKRGERAADDIMAYFDSAVDGFGTGEHEVFSGIDGMRRIIEADFAATPDGLNVDVSVLAVRPIDERLAMVSSEFVLRIPVGAESLELAGRGTQVLLRDEDGAWRIIHSHISNPSADQAADESIPFDALRARAERLERDVAERTAELAAANRELRIEAAFERVRARAIGMQTSDDLKSVAEEIRHQMGLLGQRELEVCAFHLYDGGGDTFESWGAMRIPWDSGDVVTGTAELPRRGVAVLEECIARFESDERVYTIVNEGERAFEFFAMLQERAPEVHALIMQAVESMKAESRDAVPRAFWSFADFTGGSILMVTYQPPGADARELLLRCADAFDFGYRRFKDLRAAERQVREERIEAALERVRSRTMAMHSSHELLDVGRELFRQLIDLGMPREEMETCGFVIVRDQGPFVETFLTTPDGEAFDGSFVVDYTGDESSRKKLEGWRRQERYQLQVLDSSELSDHLEFLAQQTGLPMNRFHEMAGRALPERSYNHSAFFRQGFLAVVTSAPQEDAEELYPRFARVFDLAYQRYNDLKQAEEDYRALLDEKARTEKALTDLQATQRQLIEQEKLASLGSLTAGIAHEIKNPLNFVNNFAEVSGELAGELADALAAGRNEEALQVLEELRSNAEQIARHGKRADGIVRSMMEHARGGTSARETVVVNDFLEEYVSLAWHGRRARDYGFEAEVVREFDPQAGSVEVMPQELGRVILNMLNNAFDAIKAKEDAAVTVSSRRADDHVVIAVSDNGPGIPEDIRSKIFEPFFTTKATGEGTGLGLSLSFDIVTKGHGGRLELAEGDGGGARFVITLPG